MLERRCAASRPTAAKAHARPAGARELPHDAYLYEPKWDGFRALVFRGGEEVDIRSRNDRPLARYFPELVETVLSLETDAFFLDGEILVVRDDVFDFAAIMARLHPAASRVERLRRETLRRSSRSTSSPPARTT